VTDGLLLRVLKAVVRAAWALEYGVRRGARRLSRRPAYALAGACGGCARCCEKPTIAAGPILWRLPWSRRVFLAWQRHVNGFALVEADPATRTFAFRCGHFDWATRRCDSYASRPFMCRDYPRALLDQPWPELFPTCGYRPLAPNAAAAREALARTGLSEAEREALERKMFLR
jgi:Fe-S-cluster containining protein